MQDMPMQQATNANYDKVLFYVEKLLSESDGYCGCTRCKTDVVALALNTLPPHYFVDKAHANSFDLGSSWILVDIAVRDALERVRLAPHHQVVEEETVVPKALEL